MYVAPDNIMLCCVLAYLYVLGLIWSFMMSEHVFDERPVFGVDDFGEILCAVVAHSFIF